ncbi:hypothetical protein C8Q78DRAFT_1078664 [Trametes maxima]|nr:hypothetical protein C8Q78DRAFT_1078664 [Trametes maxima]
MHPTIVKVVALAIAFALAGPMVTAIPTPDLMKRNNIPAEDPTKSNNGRIVPYP